jgi:hypothetical protein
MRMHRVPGRICPDVFDRSLLMANIPHLRTALPQMGVFRGIAFLRPTCQGYSGRTGMKTGHNKKQSSEKVLEICRGAGLLFRLGSRLQLLYIERPRRG